MRNFFTIVFGGLLVIVLGVGTVKAGIILLPRLSHFQLSSMTASVSAFISGDEDDNMIDGLSRLIRFTADEEEGPMNEISNMSSKDNSSVSAKAYIVQNLNNHNIESEINSETLLPIASLTKLITAAVATRMLDPDKRVNITKDIISTYGNTASFKVGETMRVSDLMYPLLMVSSNDAAEALAQSYGRKKFIKEMNQFTQDIGAYRTMLVDPSGLSSRNVSTAKDLSIIIDWIRTNNPNLIAITKLKTKSLRDHTWTNPTHFLSWSNYIGGKNGYTNEANRTSAVLFSMNNGPYSVIVLGSDSRDTDVFKLLSKAMNR